MPDGAVNLDTLTLTAAALRLNGTMALAPGGRPEAFAFTGRIADPEGAGPVLLPIPPMPRSPWKTPISCCSYDRESGGRLHRAGLGDRP